MQGEFCVGLRGDSYPGYRRLLRADLADTSLVRRLTEQHRANGGWGLLKDPLEVRSVLTAAEGPITVDQSFIMCNAPVGSIIRGVFSAKTWGSELPWITSPPSSMDKWDVPVPSVGPAYGPDPASSCLFVRAEVPLGLSSTSIVRVYTTRARFCCVLHSISVFVFISPQSLSYLSGRRRGINGTHCPSLIMRSLLAILLLALLVHATDGTPRSFFRFLVDYVVDFDVVFPWALETCLSAACRRTMRARSATQNSRPVKIGSRLPKAL
jgi:hypothetical protein